MYFLDELIHAFELSKPKLVICSEATLTTVLEVKKHVPSIKEVIVMANAPEKPTYLFEEPEHKYMFKMIEDSIQKVETFRVASVDTKKDTAFILMSSGTTGLPKGVVLTYQGISALIANE